MHNLIRPPGILIKDEPTSSLDEFSQFKLMGHMSDMLPRTTVIHAGIPASLIFMTGRSGSFAARSVFDANAETGS